MSLRTVNLFRPYKDLFSYDLETLVNNRLAFLENDLKAEIIEIRYTDKEHAYIVYKT